MSSFQIPKQFPKVPADRIKTGLGGKVALLLLACLSLGFLGGYLGARSNENNSLGSSSAAVQQHYVSSESQLIESIAKNVGNSVVSINVKSQGLSQNNLFGFSQPVEQQSAGTGFIVSKDGIIVTNRHVVPQGTTSVSVTLSDGTELNNVEVIGRTNENDTLDMAFLKIKDTKGKKLTPVALGNSSNVQVGDRVVAIGNALGQFQNTVTSGIISGYGRSIVAGDSSGGDSENLTNLFQTDASINQGNSGGPLVNMSGEVIGMNTAVAGGSAQNIGFAIPINDMKGIIATVLQKGKLEKPYLGVRYVNITDDFAYQYNLDIKRGAYILPATGGSDPGIVPGSPADKAGLKEKDIITKVNGTTIDDRTSLSSALGQLKVGDTAHLTVHRDGKDMNIDVTLGDTPSQ